MSRHGPPGTRLWPRGIPEATDTITDQSVRSSHHRMGSRQARRRTQPWYPPLPPTQHQLDGAKCAAEHLLAHGLPPLFPLDTIRALWRHGDRELAVTLARIRGLA